ncbi:MAG: hypothetical protein EWM72_01956 [Nitrospira sp.]|nr:MAG: hypothetical protein EWM72_01956 [Nitrospira sp.]
MRWWSVVLVLLLTGVSSVQADQSSVTIKKMPAQMGTQYFNPRRPPRGMPRLTLPEEAVCASDFLSDVSVGGQAEQMDATHGQLTINRVTVKLQLNITIWLPTNPPKTTVDYEDGHRQQGRSPQRAGLAQGRQRSAEEGGGHLTGEYNRQMPVEATREAWVRFSDGSSGAGCLRLHHRA